MEKFKGLLLDLDDTLIKSGQIYDKAMFHTAKYMSTKYKIDLDLLYENLQRQYMIVSRSFPNVHTRHSRILLYRAALDYLGIKYDLSDLPKLEMMYWDYFLKHIEVYDHVHSTLKTLHDGGIKIAIVSDGDLSLRIRKTEAAGLLNHVDEVVASEEVVFEKPFSAIFTLALSRLGLEPHQAVMIGNNYTSDIRGAQLVGIKAGIFDPAKDANLIGQEVGVEKIIPDFVIHDFKEVLELFKI